jgi:hypothetical protein
MKIKVSISRDGVWSGDGYWNGWEIFDCPAVLGDTQEESEETYDLLADGLGNCLGPAHANRPDGEYIAELIY